MSWRSRGLLAVVIGAFWATGVFADTTEDPPGLSEVPTVTKNVTGEVSGVMPQGVGVVTERNAKLGYEKERWFPIAPTVALKGLTVLTQLQVGDIVEVTYREAKDGRYEAMAVKFVRAAPPSTTGDDGSGDALANRESQP